MYLKRISNTLSPIVSGLLVLLFVTSCGTSGVTVREGKAHEVDASRIQSTSDCVIVHVDRFSRLVTIRNGDQLKGKFLLAYSKNTDTETAVLKIENTAEVRGSLSTAEILEGEPKINHIVIEAPKSRSQELAKIYRDPEQ